MALPRLVTAEQAKDHLRVDHDLEDSKIETLVQQGSAVVLNYLQQYPRTTYQSLPATTTDYVTPWPWVWTSSNPYWWPSTRVSYQQLPPYVAQYWTDDSGEPTEDVPGEVAAATLLVIGALFEDREGEKDPISTAVRSLLAMRRDPAMA